ncbi:MAG TPA: family 10 glycosylhydrolase [Armatimonadota bacterium]|nr:family 10 glycosylhydrolase [Armatimonadota bacterium]
MSTPLHSSLWKTSKSLAISAWLMGVALIPPALGENSDRMLLAQDGAACYVDFENPSNRPARGWVALYDMRCGGELPPRAPATQVVLISDGAVKSRGGVPPERLGPNEYWVMARFDDWLDLHATPGQRLDVTPATPFRPNVYSHPIDLIDKPILTNNQLAIYTPRLGRTTPSSIFRRELVVSGGRVIQWGGGNCEIPQDGFVISSHGSTALWISHRGMIGAKAAFDDEDATITIDEGAWLRNAQHQLNNVRQRLAARAVDSPPPARGRRRLRALRKTLAEARARTDSDPQSSWQSVRKVIADAKQLLYTTVDSPDDEVRGVWMPGVLTGPPLDTFIRRMETAGINTALAIRGQAARSSGDANTMFRRLRARGIRPILWSFLPCSPVESFDEALEAHPDWTDHSKTGALNLPDPACPEAMAWHCDAVERACRELDIDGIAFDYEGYDGGYSERSRQAFIAQEKLDLSCDPGELDQSADDDPVARKWRDWRRALIVRATHQLAEAARKGKPNIQVIGCVTAPSYRSSAERMYMIWPDWLELGTFDAITTMVYAQDARWVTDSCREATEIIAGRVPFWPSLILYPETSGSVPIEPELLIDQVEGARRVGAEGILLFMGVQFASYQGPRGDDVYNCLRHGLFRSSTRAGAEE